MTLQQKQVTVGIPVYNGEEFIERALQSLCAQTYPHLTILIADNASTDATEKIIRKWMAADPRIVYHRHTKNHGAFFNYDWVLKNAQTEWFIYGAYDDYWSSNYVAELVSVLDKNPNALLAVPRMVLFNEKYEEQKPFAVFDSGLSPSALMRQMLQKAHGGWYYGLAHRESFIRAFQNARYFKYTWATDFVVILPFIFSTSITGSDKAVYYKLVTDLSEMRYRPKTFTDQYTLYRDFWLQCCHYMRLQKFPLMQKIVIFPALFRYSKHAGKPRRILKAFIKKCAGREK